ncbi:hypothetical protein QBC34DRAFT_154247 [Podospora aff. communis PSN243]|uniref:Uncharacterized protein n=1 Tax=Podospora aff. communis PSN243 TaxID=3040156 RepID=A0AAV9GCU4_9PEZI|nr:hypothetical protein QBC34DRAFT_154247 [Podospora aff. communis PSN243]
MSSLSWQPSAGPARPHNYGGSRRPIYQRRSSTSRGSTSASSTASFSDDDDAITPCPPQNFTEEHRDVQQDRTPRQQPRSPKAHRPNAERRQSWRSSQVMSSEPHPESPDGDLAEVEVDSVTLWRRMLVIQRMFGCYNSARMSAALDTGAEDGFVPSRTCLDLLNDSIDQLPEESRRQLEQFLEHGESGNPSRRKSWRQRLQEMRQAR